MESYTNLQKEVQDYYGKTLQTQNDLKTNACLLGTDPGYTESQSSALSKIHDEIISKFYGCGSPIPPCLEGCTVLDLGCGSGRDSYVCSALVGNSGTVIGVDMTEEQLEVARKHQEYQREKFGLDKVNTQFIKGTIEDLKSLGIQDNSVDCIISNCVINLSGDKEQVFREAWRVLKEGGELYFSDVFADRRIPEHLQKDSMLWGECLSGALYVEDFRRLLQKAGFKTYYTKEQAKLKAQNNKVDDMIKGITFLSITVRAFKIQDLEDREEDYQQEAFYLGTIDGYPDQIAFDTKTTFKLGEPVKISRNLANILKNSRLASHFEVSEEQQHQGLLGQKDTECIPTKKGCC